MIHLSQNAANRHRKMQLQQFYLFHEKGKRAGSNWRVQEAIALSLSYQPTLLIINVFIITHIFFN